MTEPRTDDLHRTLRITAARGTAVTLGSQAVRAAIVLASVVLLARLVEPASFGLLAMVTAVTGVAEVFRDFGLSMSALRARELTHGQRSNLFWINTGVGAALTALILLSSWPIAAFYDTPALVPVVQAVSVVYLLGGMTAQFRVAINRDLRFGALAVTEVVPPAVALALALALAATGHSLAALVVQQVAMAGATLVLAAALAHWRPGRPRRGEPMRELVSFGLSYAATQLLTYATRNLDSVAIGRVWGAVPLGTYDRAFQLSVAPFNQISAPMTRVALPVLARLVDTPARYAGSLRRAQLVASYVTSGLLLLLAGLGTPVTVLLLGERWAAAGPVLSVLALGTVLRSLQQVTNWMFMSHGRADAQLRLHLVGQPVVIVLMLAGLPLGPIGVAAGSAVGYAVFLAMALPWAGRVTSTPVRPLASDATRAVLVVGLPAGVAAHLVATHVAAGPLLQVVAGVGAAAAWYLVAWAAVPRVRADVAVLRRFVTLALGGSR